jgi:two-component system sensor histidine kinase/response regulator
MTKVLVVDDEPTCIELIRELLPKEYGTETAKDGNEALLKVEKAPPDLILLDVLMPGMSGYEVCKRLKSDKKTMCIPIIMVTSLQEKEDRIKSIEVGADDFINKPVDTYELNARVKSLLRIKQYHDELVALNRHLEERVKDRTQALNETLKELARSKAELEQIVFIASRELQEPIHIATSNLELLKERYKNEAPDNEGYRIISTAADGAARMQRRINDLLVYSYTATRKEPVDCSVLLDRVTEHLRFVIEETGAKVIRKSLPVVSGDESQLYLLFCHLTENGIKFRGKATPVVDISVEQKKNEWLFCVRDNGTGIGPENYESIFMISARKRDKMQDMGIGLAVCKKIVERHGGKIWVDSVKGKGSTFYFTIPTQK